MVRNSGPGRAEKDEIEHLKVQLHAYQVRASILEQQQITTLDTLDQVNLKHRQELELERRRKRNLEIKFRRFRDSVDAVEKERDDLRDSVLQLVNKVESSHGDFKLWPHCKMQLSSLSDPIVTQNYRDFEHQPLPEQHVAYAGAIIRSLQLSLRLEREAHAESRARIHLLEAHVALRDAELERYVQHIQELPIKTSRHKGKGKEAPEKELKLAEVSSMLQRTVANNKVLEIEVQNLVNKLEHAKVTANVAVPIRSRSHSQSRPGSRARSPLLHHDIPFTETEASESYDKEKGGTAELDINIKRSSHPGDPSHNLTERSDPYPLDRIDQDKISTPALARPILQQLDHQISSLSAQIDTFKDEREALVRLVTSELRTRPPEHPGSLESQGTSSQSRQTLATTEVPHQILRSVRPIIPPSASYYIIDSYSYFDSHPSQPPPLLPPTPLHDRRLAGAHETKRPFVEDFTVKAHANRPEPPGFYNVVDQEPCFATEPFVVVPSSVDDGDGELSMELATPLIPLTNLHNDEDSGHDNVEWDNEEGPHIGQKEEGDEDARVRMIRPRVLPKSSSPSPR